MRPPDYCGMPSCVGKNIAVIVMAETRMPHVAEMMSRRILSVTINANPEMKLKKTRARKIVTSI
jgi:hypothetical protein